uniref:UDENN domain-containing protein n=1 Tax=Strongyloides papillosus TaxID=174720 RepID=A0A0N5C1A5_STREA
MSTETVKTESNDILNIIECDLNKNVTISNEQSMEVDISQNDISKNSINFNVDFKNNIEQLGSINRNIKIYKRKTRKFDMKLSRFKKNLPKDFLNVKDINKRNKKQNNISLVNDILVNVANLNITRKLKNKEKIKKRLSRLSSNIIKCDDVSLDKNCQVDYIVEALESVQETKDSTEKRQKSKKCLKKQKLFPARDEELIPDEHYLGLLYTGCEHCQAMRINNKFAFASYTGQQRDFKTPGPPTFVLHGEAKRVINTAVPKNKDNLSYGQLYFYGPDVAEDIRNKNVNAFNEISVISNLTHIISKINMLALSYKHFGDYIREQELKHKNENKAMPIFKLVLKPPANKNDRVRNLPEVTEIAAIFQSEDGEVPDYNVLLCNKTGKLETLSHYSPLKDPATYPLFFPTG